MRTLKKMQVSYIQHRIAGQSPKDAAKLAGYKQVELSAWQLEKNTLVLAELMRARIVPPPPVEIPSAAVTHVTSSVAVVGKFPPIEPVTREELISIFSNVCRDSDVPLPQRLLAGKILADVCGYNSEKNSSSAPLSLSLGSTEKSL